MHGPGAVREAVNTHGRDGPHAAVALHDVGRASKWTVEQTIVDGHQPD